MYSLSQMAFYFCYILFLYFIVRELIKKMTHCVIISKYIKDGKGTNDYTTIISFKLVTSQDEISRIRERSVAEICETVAETRRLTRVSAVGLVTFTRVSVAAVTAEPYHFFSFRQVSVEGNKGFRKRNFMFYERNHLETFRKSDFFLYFRRRNQT